MNQATKYILYKNKDGWPSISSLLFFKMIGSIYSSSDVRHCLITPSLIVLCEHLSYGKIECKSQLFLSFFICDLIHFFIKENKKYFGEVITFLHSVFHSFVDPKNTLQFWNGLSKLDLSTFPSKNQLCLGSKESNVGTNLPISLISIFSHLERNHQDYSSLNFHNFSSNLNRLIMAKAIRTLENFSQLYSDLPCFDQIFEPILNFINQAIKQNKLSVSEKPEMQNSLAPNLLSFLQQKIQSIKENRKHLSLRDFKPLSIVELDPLVHNNFRPNKDYDHNEQRKEIRKLKKMQKDQKKGISREIKKNQQIIAAQNLKKRRQEIELSNQKKKEIVKTLLNQHSELIQKHKQKFDL